MNGQIGKHRWSEEETEIQRGDFCRGGQRRHKFVPLKKKKNDKK